MRKAITLLAALGLTCYALDALIDQAHPPKPSVVVRTWTPETPFITATPEPRR